MAQTGAKYRPHRGEIMHRSHTELPAGVPTLSRGKHRNPRKGACFMEFASYLAGEPWSDHPHCTHPLLAETARLVNDYTSDAGRAELAPLIPSVIGLDSDSVEVDAGIALACARVALPVASMERQQVLAVSILAGERLLADKHGTDPDALSPASQDALAQAPQAAAWAADFVDSMGFSPRGYRRQAAPNTVRCSVRGIAEAAITDPDTLLHELLCASITACADACEKEAQVRASPDRVASTRS
jgi:hypothetical protein